jgi:hypothetical protein
MKIIGTRIKPNGGSHGCYLSCWERVRDTRWGLRPDGASMPAKQAGLSYEEVAWAGDPRKKGYEVDVRLGIPDGFGWYVIRCFNDGDREILYDPTFTE